MFSLSGKQSEQIEKELQAELRILESRRPSLLVLDDFDFLPAATDADQWQVVLERIFYGELSWHIKTLQGIRRCLRSARVFVLATAKSATSIHASLVSTGGTRFFDYTQATKPLNEVRISPDNLSNDHQQSLLK